MVADVDEAAAGAAADAVRRAGRRASAVGVDVADAAAVADLAARAVAFGGRISVVCNNAGVLVWGDTAAATPGDWRWLLDVNLLGVVHGIAAFTPVLLAQGTPARIVNTASTAGLAGSASLAAYSASKSAVIAASEALHEQLRDTPVGVTVLLPSNVESHILGAQRNRRAEYGMPAAEPMGTEPPGVGLHASTVADAALRAIRDGDLYAFTFPAADHERLRSSITERTDALLEALDRGGV